MQSLQHWIWARLSLSGNRNISFKRMCRGMLRRSKNALCMAVEVKERTLHKAEAACTMEPEKPVIIKKSIDRKTEKNWWHLCVPLVDHGHCSL